MVIAPLFILGNEGGNDFRVVLPDHVAEVSLFPVGNAVWEADRAEATVRGDEQPRSPADCEVDHLPPGHTSPPLFSGDSDRRMPMTFDS